MDVNEPAGRYLVDVRRPGRPDKRAAFPFTHREDGRITVAPCWTTVEPDGTKRQHRHRATE
jgi:hypothetical protein